MPWPTDDSALTRRLRHAVQRLAATDLRPGPTVNPLFGELVSAACTAPADLPLLRSREHVTAIRRMCAHGESNLEVFWARRIIDEPRRLTGFPYLEHYVRLIEGEYRALRRLLGRRIRRLVFAGSGPLPLTALLFRRLAPDVTVTCLDNDPEALAMGSRVLRSLSGPDEHLRFVCADAATFDYSGADVALLAALVGTVTGPGLPRGGKCGILHDAATSLADNALLAARSVPLDGRQLLYPRVDPARIPTNITVLAEWEPPTGVINSLLLMRRSPRVR